MQLQTDVEADDTQVTSPVTQPINNASPRPVAAPRAGLSSPKLSTKAAAIVAENRARLAEKQTAASLSKQSVVASQGARADSLAAKPAHSTSGANGARPKTSGIIQNKTSKETGSKPERPPKGSLDPTRDTNDYLFLSVESMDSLDVFEEPNAAAGSSKGRKFASSKKPS